MSTTYTRTETITFTETHAKRLASKVATDLKRIQRFYLSPSDEMIAKFELEITKLLKAGYLSDVTYGFQLNNNWIEPTIRFNARDLASATGTDDDPGKIRASANTSGATFYSFLNYSSAWRALNTRQQEEFENTMPFKRVFASTPGLGGYYVNDNTYSAGGRALDRSSLKTF